MVFVLKVDWILMMPDLDPALTPCSPFAGLPVALTSGHGLIVSDRDGLGLATILVKKGKRAALERHIHEHFRLELPQGPRRTAAGNVALAGTGPGAWLATHERGGNAFAASLTKAIGDLAAVSDQSDGYAVLRLSGLRVRDTLAKLVPIDVHPCVFKVGDVATTVAAHIGATLWRLEDGPDGSPVFEISIFRSFAGSFWHMLSDSAAEFGS
jgi:heterotetrameric sarcosine oxidase gamma subunit